MKNIRKPQLEDVMGTIKKCIKLHKYTHSSHALQRQKERNIELPDVLYVLKNGYHEKKKTHFDEVYFAWKYAIRGKTVDNQDIRIIVAFEDECMFIITVMEVL